MRFSPFGISSPILDPTTNKISGFVGGNGGRKFPIDMAGFATSLRYIKFYHDYKIVHIFYPDHIPTTRIMISKGMVSKGQYSKFGTVKGFQYSF